jgi:hypothetical protein
VAGELRLPEIEPLISGEETVGSVEVILTGSRHLHQRRIQVRALRQTDITPANGRQRIERVLSARIDRYGQTRRLPTRHSNVGTGGWRCLGHIGNLRDRSVGRARTCRRVKELRCRDQSDKHNRDRDSECPPLDGGSTTS